jgi:hypothetical protein
LLGVLYFLSQSVELPAQDVQAGLVTVTEDRFGQPFDWSRVTRKIMAIHSPEKRPDNAYVAVQHRGWRFYIAADDHRSKATWSLLNILFALQSASAQGEVTAPHAADRQVRGLVASQWRVALVAARSGQVGRPP